MAYLTTEQIKRLQTLSSIQLNISEQKDFLQKLDPVIAKLDELGSVDISDINTSMASGDSKNSTTLRVLDITSSGEAQKDIAQNIMKNIEHEVINNSIVIKSVLT